MLNVSKLQKKSKPAPLDIFTALILNVATHRPDLTGQPAIYDGLTGKQSAAIVKRLQDQYEKHGGNPAAEQHYFNIYILVAEMLDETEERLTRINSNMTALYFYQRTLLDAIGTDREAETIRELQRLYQDITARNNETQEARLYFKGYNAFIEAITLLSGVPEISSMQVSNKMHEAGKHTQQPADILRDYEPINNGFILPPFYVNAKMTAQLQEKAKQNNNEALHGLIDMMRLDRLEPAEELKHADRVARFYNEMRNVPGLADYYFLMMLRRKIRTALEGWDNE